MYNLDTLFNTGNTEFIEKIEAFDNRNNIKLLNIELDGSTYTIPAELEKLTYKGKRQSYGRLASLYKIHVSMWHLLPLTSPRVKLSRLLISYAVYAVCRVAGLL